MMIKISSFVTGKTVYARASTWKLFGKVIGVSVVLS
jgi:hypothetical protein